MRKVVLKSMFGSYPKTAPLKDGSVVSEMVSLEIAPVDTAQKAFKDVVRNHLYDVSELAIVTYLLAYDAGHQYNLLPFVMNGGYHHKSIYSRADDVFGPVDLAGKRVAMRSYSQTAPTWVRGILSEAYGLDMTAVNWYSQQGAHVAEYRDPSWVCKLDPELGLEQALLEGKVDAIIAGGAIQNKDKLRHIIDDPMRAGESWSERTGVVPINHMVVVKRDTVASQPEAVAEVFRMLVQSRQVSGQDAKPGSRDTQPVGFEAISLSLERAIRYTYDQKMISRPYSAEDLYGDVMNIIKA